ncbi:hypothetical protein TNCV_361301 [Trichonephila clavipes]|nr:hypothetical protein TNCV_361301 [Trichonephila clavipes]
MSIDNGPHNLEPQLSDKNDTLEKASHYINFPTARSYTRAFGDEPRTFEPWSSDDVGVEVKVLLREAG